MLRIISFYHLIRANFLKLAVQVHRDACFRKLEFRKKNVPHKYGAFHVALVTPRFHLIGRRRLIKANCYQEMQFCKPKICSIKPYSDVLGDERVWRLIAEYLVICCLQTKNTTNTYHFVHRYNFNLKNKHILILHISIIFLFINVLIQFIG